MTSVDHILKLNREFYQLIAEQFLKTRQKSWEGWYRLLPHINTKNTLRVLDLGCGNGRFLKFLISQLHKDNWEYVGYDNNQTFLQEAEQISPKAILHNQDVFNLEESWGNNPYNLIVAFGLTHHLPKSNLREKWLAKISNSLSRKGILVLTFWNFSKDKVVQTISEKEQNYLLGFDKHPQAQRFCHYFSNKELETIIDQFRNLGLVLLEKYLADGKDHKRNTYLILEKV